MLSAGQTFARYVIEELIGEGGMGEVYRARDEKLRRKVALKVLHPDVAIPDAAARLVREARAAASLTHPNTIAIHDLGEVDGAVFVVMELVSGAPLRAFVGDPKIPIARKLRWLVDVARGLAAAHGAGLVHRDVKPANVMISDDDIVKVLDFGLAKTIEAASMNTEVGIVVGTPRYLAPELFTGAKADARSDQFAFGVTAYELLAGVHPGGPTGAVPAALDSFVPDVSAHLARIVARALSRKPADRFPSMDDVAAALEEERHAIRPVAAVNAAPSTRREGAASVALAPTELASDPAPRPSPTRPLATDLVRPSSARPVTIVLGLVLLAGLGGGYYALADRSTPTGKPPSAEADGGDASASETSVVEIGDDVDAEVLDGSVEPNVDATAPRGTWPAVVDEFEDPWRKKTGPDAGR